jgi:hypothetical protein
VYSPHRKEKKVTKSVLCAKVEVKEMKAYGSVRSVALLFIETIVWKPTILRNHIRPAVLAICYFIYFACKILEKNIHCLILYDF